MTEPVVIQAWLLSLIGATVLILLSIIAVFLGRLLRQFDGLQEGLGTLNQTMIKIDGDMTGKLRVVDVQYQQLDERMKDFEQVWDRLRKNETTIAEIAVAGCEPFRNKQCLPRS